MTQVQAKTPKLPPLRQTDSARGTSSTKAIVIVEYSDYTCSYCRTSELELNSVLASYPNEIRHIYRDLPIVSDRPDAILASSASRCAKEQGKFWPMHDALLKMTTIDTTSLQDTATILKMNVQTFNACVQSGKYIVEIQNDIQTAKDQGITESPTYFIGNAVLTGYVKASDFQWAILKERVF